MMAGSTDYHLGGFEPYRIHLQNSVYKPLMLGTRCHMLAMYVVLESYLGWFATIPKHMKDNRDLISEKVPTTWDETKVVDAKVGEYITIARKKNDDWYVGTIKITQPGIFLLAWIFLAMGITLLKCGPMRPM